MTGLFVYLGLAFVFSNALLTYYIAMQRGLRRPVLWFFVGLLFNVYGIVAVLVTDPEKFNNTEKKKNKRLYTAYKSA